MPHTHTLRVYYEDTDLAGIVYYANYLKFIERGRSEWVRDLGLDQTRLRTDTGLVFAVRRIVADYLAPAQFDDLLTVTTVVRATSGVRMVLDQAVLRDGAAIFVAEVTLVCLNGAGRPVRFPKAMRDRIAPQNMD